MSMAQPQEIVHRRNEKVGTVVSTKMAKTIVVEVTRLVQHRLYRRTVSRRSKFYAHDENGTAKLGDRVRIIESRPLSKLKRWELKEVVWKTTRLGVDAAGEDVQA
jgi:small subunit ribosomal protein S17